LKKEIVINRSRVPKAIYYLVLALLACSCVLNSTGLRQALSLAAIRHLNLDYMRNYDEIKAELIQIAEVLKKYPEEIQPKVFDILTSQFLGDQPPKRQAKTTFDSEDPSSGQSEKQSGRLKASGKGSGKTKETFGLLKDLDLRKDKQTFRDFYETKQPSSAGEFNTISVYFLSEILQISGITPSHIYTCYKEVTKRPPEAFIQSLRDASSKNGYLDISDINDIKIPLRGRNFVDHDLPKKKAK
jgi:hypothetical protein